MAVHKDPLCTMGPTGWGGLLCNVQHDRLGNKSHINKITLCGGRRRGRGGGWGFIDLMKGRRAVCKISGLNGCQLLTQTQTNKKRAQTSQARKEGEAKSPPFLTELLTHRPRTLCDPAAALKGSEFGVSMETNHSLSNGQRLN